MVFLGRRLRREAIEGVELGMVHKEKWYREALFVRQWSEAWKRWEMSNSDEDLMSLLQIYTRLGAPREKAVEINTKLLQDLCRYLEGQLPENEGYVIEQKGGLYISVWHAGPLLLHYVPSIAHSWERGTPVYKVDSLRNNYLSRKGPNMELFEIYRTPQEIATWVRGWAEYAP